VKVIFKNWTSWQWSSRLKLEKNSCGVSQDREMYFLKTLIPRPLKYIKLIIMIMGFGKDMFMQTLWRRENFNHHFKLFICKLINMAWLSRRLRNPSKLLLTTQLSTWSSDVTTLLSRVVHLNIWNTTKLKITFMLNKSWEIQCSNS